jgi:hypothetical protein
MPLPNHSCQSCLCMVIIAIIVTHHGQAFCLSPCKQCCTQSCILFVERMMEKFCGICEFHRPHKTVPHAFLSKCQYAVVRPHHYFIVVPSVHFLDQKKTIQPKLNHTIQSRIVNLVRPPAPWSTTSKAKTTS